MRKVKMLNRISIDGYFASSNEANFGMDWFIHDPEVDKLAHELGGKMNTLILGGTTFRGFERFWVPVLNDPLAPAHLRETARELTAMTKIVFSRTMNHSNWANTEMYDGKLTEVIGQIKQTADSDILVLGSGSIVRQLAQEGLIDEFIFIVTPVVAGEGRPLFPNTGLFGLSMASAYTFDSGNVVLHYLLKKA